MTSSPGHSLPNIASLSRSTSTLDCPHTTWDEPPVDHKLFIMAEAITILGAIRTSQQVLWDFSQLIRRYRHLPGRVQDLEQNLNSCQVALRIWKRQWDVFDHHPGKHDPDTHNCVYISDRIQIFTTKSSGAREDGAKFKSAFNPSRCSPRWCGVRSTALSDQPSSTKVEAGTRDTMGASTGTRHSALWTA